MPEPDLEPRMRDLVKRPGVLEYRRIRAEGPQERLRHAFALVAFAERFRERAAALEAKRAPEE